MEHDLLLLADGEFLRIDSDDGRDIVPFSRSMQRNSVFLPDYLEELLQKIASKQGEGKAKIIRNAILREVRSYIEELEKVPESGPYDKLSIGNDGPEQIASDAESDLEWVKETFRKFVAQDAKFPEPTRSKLQKS
jgi:predicted DNA-binding protein